MIEHFAIRFNIQKKETETLQVLQEQLSDLIESAIAIPNPLPSVESNASR
jgi:hypothetical protein